MDHIQISMGRGSEFQCQALQSHLQQILRAE